MVIVMVTGTSNAVNLTDGLDGLASGAAIMVLIVYVIIGDWQYRNDCITVLSFGCSDVRDPRDVAVVAATVAGACLGFLWWNAPPAKIFMGDTGSLALGGALAGLAIVTRTELLLLLLGGLTRSPLSHPRHPSSLAVTLYPAEGSCPGPLPVPAAQCTGSVEHRPAWDRVDGTLTRLEQARHVTWVRLFPGEGPGGRRRPGPRIFPPAPPAAPVL